MTNITIDEFQSLMDNDASLVVDTLYMNSEFEELFETGSLTTDINGTSVVISITVTKDA